MSPARQADPDLDNLIDEITVDSHDEDASFPCNGTVIGEEVEILSVTRGDNRSELIATCQRDGHRYEVALLDIDINADATTSRLIAAYRRWIGA